MNRSRSGRRAALTTFIHTLSRSLLAAALVAGLSAPARAADAAARETTSTSQDVVVSGIVVTAAGTPVIGARVSAGPNGPDASTDTQGHYTLRLPPGDHVLHVTHPSYEPADRTIRVTAGLAVPDITLDPRPFRFEENVVVRAVRAEPDAPVTTANLGRAEIASLNYGQEVPFLLEAQPSITQYADAGSGVGYAYLSLRGIQQTRLNMTLDGVPLNEPEDSAVYFSDYADLAASIDSVQIQRGVGTSTVGAASYGGSINFASIEPKDKPEVSADTTLGSFGTRRVALALHSGKVGPGLAFYARAAYRDSNGYRDNSGVTQDGLFYGATRRDDRSFLKIFGFVGRERTQLAYYAVEKDLLTEDRRQNPLSPEERDNFLQALTHVQYTRYLSGNTSVAVQGYYQDAGGWYRIFADPERTSLYQYGLHWGYAGGMVNVQHARGNLMVTAGAHGYEYESRHTRDVVDAGHDYTNHGYKTTADAFTKVAWTAGPAHLYGDVQVRHAGFRYQGDLDIGSIGWTFVNPKAGARVRLSPAVDAYASIGRMTREPTRSDLFAGEDNPTVVYDLHAVDPEHVTDVEAGVTVRTRGVAVSADVYAMEFRNEIALTGELSDIGLPLRRNVPRSHRRGVELDVEWRPLAALRLATTASVSHDRIAEWTQYFDVYDAAGNWIDSVPQTFRNVRPLLTPAVVLNQRVEVTPTSGLTLAAAGRWVASSWLDNTNSDDLRTPSWFDLDLSASFSLERWVSAGHPRVRLQIDNALDSRGIYPSGYSYQYLVRDPAAGETSFGVPYFYPQATRSVFVGLEVRM